MGKQRTSRPPDAETPVRELMQERPPRTLHLDSEARAKLLRFRSTRLEMVGEHDAPMPEPWSRTIVWMADALEALGIPGRVSLADVKEMASKRLLKGKDGAA